MLSAQSSHALTSAKAQTTIDKEHQTLFGASPSIFFSCTHGESNLYPLAYYNVIKSYHDQARYKMCI